VAITVNEPAVPTPKVVAGALVIAGASFTVRVNGWVVVPLVLVAMMLMA
jgi:hypothetical protein